MLALLPIPPLRRGGEIVTGGAWDGPLRLLIELTREMHPMGCDTSAGSCDAAAKTRARSDDLGLFGEVAGDGVALAAVDQLGLLFGADLLRLPAARAEAAARRRVRRRWHVALEHDAVAGPLLARVG